MDEQSLQSPQAEVSSETPPKKSTLPPILLGILLLTIVGVGSFYFGKRQVNTQPVTSTSPTITQNLLPTPFPTLSIEIAEGRTNQLKTLINKTDNFSVTFPADWKVEMNCEGKAGPSYVCFKSPDFKESQAGFIMGNPISGGAILLTVHAENTMNVNPLCDSNIKGFQFPCTEVLIGNIKAWRSVIPKSTSQVPTYPNVENTIVLSFVAKGKRFIWTGYYNDQSKNNIQQTFDQILSTFKFL